MTTTARMSSSSGINAGDDAVLLGLGHHGVELTQANAQQLGHLLLLHLGLELKKLDGAD